MNKQEPDKMSHNIADRVGQMILRLDEVTDKLKNIINGSRCVLFINIAILSMNVYIIFFMPAKNESELNILKAQHWELKAHTALLDSIFQS